MPQHHPKSHNIPVLKQLMEGTSRDLLRPAPSWSLLLSPNLPSFCAGTQIVTQPAVEHVPQEKSFIRFTVRQKTSEQPSAWRVGENRLLIECVGFGCLLHHLKEIPLRQELQYFHLVMIPTCATRNIHLAQRMRLSTQWAILQRSIFAGGSTDLGQPCVRMSGPKDQ